MAPNPEGLIDDNAIEELKKIGKLWEHPGKAPELPVYKTPIIASNLAKAQKMNSSWSFDLFTSDYANDDDFWGRSWIPSPLTEGDNFLEVVFDEPTEINMVGFVELYGWYSGYKGYDPNSLFESTLKSYEMQLWNGKEWLKVPLTHKSKRIRMHEIELQKVEKVRLIFNDFEGYFGISEMMVYRTNNDKIL